METGQLMNNRIDKDNNNNIETSDSNLPDDNEVRLELLSLFASTTAFNLIFYRLFLPSP